MSVAIALFAIAGCIFFFSDHRVAGAICELIVVLLSLWSAS